LPLGNIHKTFAGFPAVFPRAQLVQRFGYAKHRTVRDGQNNDPRHGLSGVFMFFDCGFRFTGSRVASIIPSPPTSPHSLTVTAPSHSRALGHGRARLLGGAARIALPAASVIVALGVGLPSEANAQSSGFNGTQATTYTLTTGTNTATFTFGPNTVIGPTVLGTAGVTGDTLTSWNIINQGQINGGGGGGHSTGIFLDTAGGNSVTNSGTITYGVSLGAGSTLNNLAAGTITGNGASSITATDVTNAGLINGGGVALTGSGLGASLTNQSSGIITGSVTSLGTLPATVTNAGTLSGGVYLHATGGGTVINQSGGTITNGTTFADAAVTLGDVQGAPIGGGTVNNAGTIAGVGTGGLGGTDGIALTTGSVTNLGGGTITSAAGNGIYIAGIGPSSITNQAGGSITGATNGISTGRYGVTTATNSGAITGTAANGIYLQNGGNVTNQAGGTITGGVNGVLFLNSGRSAATVTNAGTITGTSGAGVSMGFSASPANAASLTNLRGGIITGTTGVYIYTGPEPVTITNAGTITGTGGTAIQFVGISDFNTLILQTGSVLNGTAVGAPAGFDVLVLQGAGTANNNFQNFSTIEVDASGIWALNGVFTTIRGLSAAINSGTLVVGDGTHPGAQFPGVVTIFAGATLGGQGTVGGVTAAPGGTIAPGVVSPFSTLNVTSNVQFDVGSFFKVNVNAAGQTDKLAVGGTATLTGGTVQVVAQSANLTATTYTILTAGTRNSTTFAGVTASSIFLTPTLTYPSQQEVDLTLTSKAFNTAASTPNQTAVANALNAGAQNALTAVLFGQTSIAGAEQVFNALSGEFYASLQNSQADQTLIAREAMLGRLRQGDAGGDTAALAFGGPELSYAESTDGAVKAPAAANGGYDVTSWLQGFGGTGHVDGNSNASALGTTFSGFLTGTDARFGLLRAGLMGGYTHTDLNVNALASSGGIDSAQLGAYAGMTVGAFHLRGGASGSFDTIDANRMIALPGFAESTHAHFNGTTGQVFGEFAYSTSINQVALEPFAGLAYVHVHDAAFLESGGLAALSGSASDLGVGYSSLGLRAGTMWTLANGTVLVPHASATWQHAFGDVTPTAALAFQSTGASFSVSGVPIAADTAVIEAGLDWRITAQMKFGIGYQGELAKTANTNMAKGNFTWNF
jgi:outer membrane autotransporter protein